MKPEQFTQYMQQKMLTAMAQSMTATANEAKNWTLDRFRFQNWVDRAPEPWQPRKANAKRNKGRALLVDTGRLKRSINVFSVGATGFKYGSDGVKYASAHNYGEFVPRHARSETFQRKRSSSGKFAKGKTAGRGFTFGAGGFNMPKRQFLGASFHLENILRRRMTVEMLRRMKQ